MTGIPVTKIPSGAWVTLLAQGNPPDKGIATIDRDPPRNPVADLQREKSEISVRPDRGLTSREGPPSDPYRIRYVENKWFSRTCFNRKAMARISLGRKS